MFYRKSFLATAALLLAATEITAWSAQLPALRPIPVKAPGTAMAPPAIEVAFRKYFHHPNSGEIVRCINPTTNQLDLLLVEKGPNGTVSYISREDKLNNIKTNVIAAIRDDNMINDYWDSSEDEQQTIIDRELGEKKKAVEDAITYDQFQRYNSNPDAVSKLSWLSPINAAQAVLSQQVDKAEIDAIYGDPNWLSNVQAWVVAHQDHELEADQIALKPVPPDSFAAEFPSIQRAIVSGSPLEAAVVNVLELGSDPEINAKMHLDLRLSRNPRGIYERAPIFYARLFVI